MGVRPGSDGIYETYHTMVDDEGNGNDEGGDVGMEDRVERGDGSGSGAEMVEYEMREDVDLLGR